MQRGNKDVLSMNKKWRFFRGDLKKGVTENLIQDSEWECVDLPHTVRLEPAECSGGVNYQGKAWYTKKFYIDKEDLDKKLFLEFEGAKHVLQLWINDKEVGYHEGGYLPYVVEVGDYVHKEENQVNKIVVCVDNSDDENIPPGKSQDTLDFCYFGGIYRNVWLHKKERLYITHPIQAQKVAGGGIFVTTDKIDNINHTATLGIKTHLKNDYSIAKEVVLSYKLFDANEKLVCSEEVAQKVEANTDYIDERMLEVKGPKLWCIEAPYLYKLKVEVLVEEQPLDEVSLQVGIRHIKFDEEGFQLNGKEVKLIGANKHQEYVYIGDGLSDTMHYREAVKLKEAGFNCVRTGHYPPGQAFIQACDQVGLVCIVPIPGWQWFKDEPIFKERCYQNLREMIRLYRNHPSIVLWEPILNETRYTEDFAREVYRITHEEYPGEGCYAAADAYLALGDLFDVPYGNEKGTLHEKKCCFVREYGDNYREQFGPQKTIKRCSRGDKGYYPGGQEAMLKSAMERAVQTDRLLLHKQIAGGAIWTGIDCNRGYMSNIAATGVLDLYRLPKFSYYFYKSQMAKEPMVFAATYWNKALCPLVVFSNCEEITIRINGKRVATQVANRTYLEREDTLANASHFKTSVVNCIPFEMVDATSKGLPHPPFVFEDICFEEGILEVEGMCDGQVVATQVLTTPQTPFAIELTKDECGQPLVADGVDTVMIHAFIKDEKGMMVPEAYNQIHFEVEGEATIVGDGDQRIKANPIAVEAGAIGVLIRAKEKAGKIKITAYSEGLREGTITLDSVEDKLTYVQAPVEENIPSIVTYEVDEKQASKKIAFNEFDLATGKKIITSSDCEGHLGGAMVDNNQNTSWRAATDANEWLLINLEKPYHLTGCKIWWESDNTDYHYTIYVSTDCLEWKEVVNKIGTGQDVKPDLLDVPEVRYVKIVITEVSKGVPEICSLQIFGV